MSYIKPNLIIVPSLSEISSQSSSLQSNVQFDSFNITDNYFLIGDPGCGKSEFLNRYSDKMKSVLHCGIFHLRKVNISLEDYIVGEGNNELSNNSFELFDKDDILICLDGLDEMNMENIDSISNQILAFKNKFPTIKLIISCRTHHLKKYESKFPNFKVLKIEPFDIHQSINFLKNHCIAFSKLSKDEIFHKIQEHKALQSNRSKKTFSIPRYLSLYAALIDLVGIDKALSMSRSEVFEYFVVERIKTEAEKALQKGVNYISKIYYIKQALERLALVMELKRDNIITKDDFITFLLDTNFNLDAQLMLEIFYDGTVLKDNGSYLEFDNTEFQEYLAAKAITRLERTEQVIFDVAIEPIFKNFYNSWWDVISYLIELQPNLLLPLIKYSKKKEIEQNFYWISYSSKDYFHGNIDEKAQIFKEIFDYHLQHNTLLGGYYEPLSFFFVPEKHKTLLINSVRGDYTDFMHVIRANAATLLKELFKNEVYNEGEKQEWKEKLIGYILLPLKHGDGDTMHRFAMHALMEIINDIEELKPILKLYEKRTNSISDAIVSACRKVNPNHKLSIELFIKNVSRNRIFSDHPYHSINTSRGFKFFFDTLINWLTRNSKTKRVKRNFLSAKEIVDDYQTRNDELFFKALAVHWTKEIEDSVVKLLSMTSQYMYRTNRTYFLYKLIDLLKSKNPYSILDCFNYSHKKGFTKDAHRISFLFSGLLTKDTIEPFIQANEAIDLDLYLVKSAINFSEDEEVFLQFQKYFPKEYNQKIHNNKINNRRVEDRKNKELFRQHQSLEKFIFCLNQSHEHVLFDYSESKYIQENLPASRVLALKRLVTNVLEKYDVLETKLTINENRYTVSGIVRLYDIAIDLVRKLDINIDSYRQKILSCIFFDLEKKVFELIQNPTEDEIEILLRTRLEKRNDDLFENNINAFLESCDVYDIQGATDLLRKMIYNVNLSNYQKIKIFEILDKWKDEELLLLKLYDYYEKEFTQLEISFKESNNENDLQLLTAYDLLKQINFKLLQKNNPQAVKWLIEEINKHKYVYFRNANSYHYISGVPKRMSEGLFRNLSIVEGIVHRDQILLLLDYSFQILKKDIRNYREYVNNIWDGIGNYFISLSNEKSLIEDNINALTEITEKYINEDFYSWYKTRIDRIKLKYSQTLGMPSKIFTAIKNYNELRAKKYLQITTSRELFIFIKRIINEDFRYWIQQEGGYKLFTTVPSRGRETFIQKVAVPLLENFLLQKGIRSSDIQPLDFKIYREPQNPKDKRADLVITYGSVGSIMIEFKREYNLSSPVDYKDTMYEYMKSTYSEFGILLIFKDDPKINKTTPFRDRLYSVAEIYKTNDDIEVIGIDCTIPDSK